MNMGLDKTGGDEPAIEVDYPTIGFQPRCDCRDLSPVIPMSQRSRLSSRAFFRMRSITTLLYSASPFCCSSASPSPL